MLTSKRMRQIWTIALLCLAVSCTSLTSSDKFMEPGVALPLAQDRAANLSSVVYDLSFEVPSCKDSSISAKETIALTMNSRKDLILDFREDPSHIGEVVVNGSTVQPLVENEHIKIAKSDLLRGANSIQISFLAGEQSLNRRDELLYTLLVPDRARTLFPCFEQPNIKAVYNLTLTVPSDWCAISNGAAIEETIGDGSKTIRFAPTEPLSTYLFSFVAGGFECFTATKDGRTISMYHRETDPAKIAQCQEVTDLVMSSLDFMEEWTGIKYPFAKYDFIVLPSFQYGGMEHTGATLYNDRRIFLGEKPTTEELLGRASLIAHETAHMWFGDFVTMEWFNDVWTKEVFANWMAAQMVRPLFPDVDHVLGDLTSYFAPAYSEDRTPGSNAIQRPLENLRDAGLIYCNIIYDKAPVMMDKLARRMGADSFKRGVRAYLNAHAYSNATWDDLVACLQAEADFNVSEWSRVWVKEKGMPVHESSFTDSTLTLRQIDPFGQGNLWQQTIACTAIDDQGQTACLTFDFSDSDHVAAKAPFPIRQVLPNTDALGYGCFLLDSAQAEFIRETFPRQDAKCRMSLLMSLHENVWRGILPADEFAAWAGTAIMEETNPLILSAMISYAVSAERMSPSGKLENALLSLASDPSRSHEARLLAFRQLTGLASSDVINEQLYGIWKSQKPFDGLKLGENDYTSLSYELMVRFPERYAQIKDVQRSRISNKDRLQVFDFICQAAAPDQESRDEFFMSLMEPSNRRPESSALSALRLLNHPLRQAESIRYIKPALEELPEIQRTGDIFFPASWCKALLSSHLSTEAKEEVQSYLDSHEDENPLLLTKVLHTVRP